MQLGYSWIDDVSRVIATLIPKFSNIDLGTEQWPFRKLVVREGVAGKVTEVTPAGTTITDAVELESATTFLTGSAGATAGVKLNDDVAVGNSQYVINYASSAIKLYPGNAAGVIIAAGVAQSPGASVNLTQNGTYLVVKKDEDEWSLTAVS